MIRRPVVLVVLALLAACQSGAEPGEKGPAAKGDPSAPAGGRGATSSATPARPGSGESFTTEERATMEAAWKAFVDDSPSWPLYRDDWVSIGPAATNTLVDNLFRAMVLAQARNFPEGYDRARKELILLGPASVPTLVGVLRRGTYRDPAKDEDRPLPSGLVTDLTDLLVAIGPSSAVPLTRLLEHDSDAVRRASAEALGRLGDDRGFRPLTEMLAGAKDWADRMVAARAVGYFDKPEAGRALVRALEDADESVVLEAARSLARMRSAPSVPALEKRAAKARASGEFRVERACRAAAKTIRGEP